MCRPEYLFHTRDFCEALAIDDGTTQDLIEMRVVSAPRPSTEHGQPAGWTIHDLRRAAIAEYLYRQKLPRPEIRRFLAEVQNTDLDTQAEEHAKFLVISHKATGENSPQWISAGDELLMALAGEAMPGSVACDQTTVPVEDLVRQMESRLLRLCGRGGFVPE